MLAKIASEALMPSTTDCCEGVSARPLNDSVEPELFDESVVTTLKVTAFPPGYTGVIVSVMVPECRVMAVTAPVKGFTVSDVTESSKASRPDGVTPPGYAINGLEIRL